MKNNKGFTLIELIIVIAIIGILAAIAVPTIFNAQTKAKESATKAMASNVFRKYIEKDGALERRFQKVMVNPPSLDETIQILNGIKEKYEEHHQVQLSDSAIRACVELSDRYISDKYLPDKAIDVMDEVGSHVHINNIHVPDEIVKLEKNISSLRKKKESVIAKQKFEQAAEMRDKERRMIAKLKVAQDKWDIQVVRHLFHLDK